MACIHRYHKHIYASIGLPGDYAYLFVLAIGLPCGLVCYQLAFKHLQCLHCMHVHKLLVD